MAYQGRNVDHGAAHGDHTGLPRDALGCDRLGSPRDDQQSIVQCKHPGDHQCSELAEAV